MQPPVAFAELAKKRGLCMATPTVESLMAIGPIGSDIGDEDPVALIGVEDTDGKRSTLKLQTAGQKIQDESASVTLASDDDLVIAVADLLSRFGEVQSTPTANTVLARLKDLATIFGEVSDTPTANTLADRLKALLTAQSAVSTILGEVSDTPTANTLADRLKALLTVQSAVSTILGEVSDTPTANTLADRLKALLTAQSAVSTILGEVSDTPTANTLADRLKALLTAQSAVSTILGEVSDTPTANTLADRLKALLTAQSAVSTILGEVSATPTANTLADRLKALLTGITLAAGSHEVGKVNVKIFNIAASGAGILTRPANTTPYSIGDSVSDNATAASVTALPITLSDTNDDPLNITEIEFDTTDTGFANAYVKVHVFNSDPTASSGVGGGDNAAWSQKRAGWVGAFSGQLTGFSDGCRGNLISNGAPVRIANVESGGKRLWWQLQVMSAVTPSANSTVFTPRFKGYQGRV
jgi:uncharacterized membrane protein YfbV (UPF0208 family)